MIEPNAIAGAGLVILGSKELLNKLLGPTADYIGGELKNIAERCNINLDNVFRRALQKLGPRANMPRAVNPRVLKHVISEGQFCEDVIMAEYLGGVLASTKSGTPRDDRGIYYLNLISELSSYQIRTHYMIYSSIVQYGSKFNQDTSFWYLNDGITVLIPEHEYVMSMDYSGEESHEDISHHSFLGLESSNLSKGGNQIINRDSRPFPGVPFRYFWPTRFGFELFLWGLGLGHMRVSSYFDIDPNIHLPVTPVPKAVSIQLGRVSY